jgi:hypothetical protein
LGTCLNHRQPHRRLGGPPGLRSCAPAPVGCIWGRPYRGEGPGEVALEGENRQLSRADAAQAGGDQVSVEQGAVEGNEKREAGAVEEQVAGIGGVDLGAGDVEPHQVR